MQSTSDVIGWNDGAHAERLSQIRELVADDVALARLVLYDVLEPVLRESRGLTGDTHTEAAWLREVVRGYEASYCPHCLQDPRDGEQHLEDCPVGLALERADLLSGLGVPEIA